MTLLQVYDQMPDEYVPKMEQASQKQEIPLQQNVLSMKEKTVTLLVEFGCVLLRISYQE